MDAGFDLTNISPTNWEKILDLAGITNIEPKRKELYWLWTGENIEIRTSNNPITGKIAQEKHKYGVYNEDVGHAGCIGLTGESEKVRAIFSKIKELASYIKDENPSEKEFI